MISDRVRDRIRAKLCAVEGVTTADVIATASDAVKCFVAGGDDVAIHEALHRSVPCGFLTEGDIAGIVRDSCGGMQRYQFSRLPHQYRGTNG